MPATYPGNRQCEKRDRDSTGTTIQSCDIDVMNEPLEGICHAANAVA